MATDVAESTGPAGPAVTGATVTTELAVTGMTCGTCSARIQRRLGRLPGVEAAVNYATGRARVTHPADLDAAELVTAVTALGFGAAPVEPLVPASASAVPAPRRAPGRRPHPPRRWTRRTPSSPSCATARSSASR